MDDKPIDTILYNGLIIILFNWALVLKVEILKVNFLKTLFYKFLQILSHIKIILK